MIYMFNWFPGKIIFLHCWHLIHYFMLTSTLGGFSIDLWAICMIGILSGKTCLFCLFMCLGHRESIRDFQSHACSALTNFRFNFRLIFDSNRVCNWNGLCRGFIVCFFSGLKFGPLALSIPCMFYLLLLIWLKKLWKVTKYETFGTMKICIYSVKCGKWFRQTNTEAVRMQLLPLYGWNQKCIEHEKHYLEAVWFINDAGVHKAHLNMVVYVITN